MGLRLYVSDGETEICLGNLYRAHPESYFLAAKYLADICFPFQNDVFEYSDRTEQYPESEKEEYMLFFQCVEATRAYKIRACEFRRFFMLYAHDCAYDAGYKPECPMCFLDSDKEKIVEWR